MPPQSPFRAWKRKGHPHPAPATSRIGRADLDDDTGTPQTIGSFGLGAGYPGFVTRCRRIQIWRWDPHRQWVSQRVRHLHKSGALIDRDDKTFWAVSPPPVSSWALAIGRPMRRRAGSSAWRFHCSAAHRQFAQCFAVSPPDPAGPYSSGLWLRHGRPRLSNRRGRLLRDVEHLREQRTFTGAETCAWNRGDLLGGVANPSSSSNLRRGRQPLRRRWPNTTASGLSELSRTSIDGPAEPVGFHVDWVRGELDVYRPDHVMTSAAPFALLRCHAAFRTRVVRCLSPRSATV